MSKLVPVDDVLIFVAMAHKDMGEHHLRDTDRTTPAGVVAVTDLQVTSQVSWKRLNPLSELFFFALEKRVEAFAVAQPDQGVEVDLELGSCLLNLLLQRIISELLIVHLRAGFLVLLVQQKNR